MNFTLDEIREASQIYFYCEDLGESICIKEYLKKILEKVWEESEGFNGKRPFGNSGWQWDIYAALIKEKIIDGKLDEDGYVEKCDTKIADELIMGVIRDL